MILLPFPCQGAISPLWQRSNFLFTGFHSALKGKFIELKRGLSQFSYRIYLPFCCSALKLFTLTLVHCPKQLVFSFLVNLCPPNVSGHSSSRLEWAPRQIRLRHSELFWRSRKYCVIRAPRIRDIYFLLELHSTFWLWLCFFCLGVHRNRTVTVWKTLWSPSQVACYSKILVFWVVTTSIYASSTMLELMMRVTGL